VSHGEAWNYTDEKSFYTQVGWVVEHDVHDVNYLRFLNGEIASLRAVGYGRLPRNPSSLKVTFTYEDGTPGLFQTATGMQVCSLYVHATFDGGVVCGLLSSQNADFADVGQAVRSKSDTRFGGCRTGAGRWG